MTSFKINLSLILLITTCLFLVSCHNRLLVKPERYVYKQKGLLVFVDRDSVIYNREGCIYNDSLVSDFFIPFKFKSGIISLKDLQSVFDRAENEATFFSFVRDCNEESRRSSIREAKVFNLDQHLDSYVRSSKIFVLPVEISFLKISSDDEYFNYFLRSKIIFFNGKRIVLNFQHNYFDVLQDGVLENDWIK